jgi:hypothetical protein
VLRSATSIASDVAGLRLVLGARGARRATTRDLAPAFAAAHL